MEKLFEGRLMIYGGRLARIVGGSSVVEGRLSYGLQVFSGLPLSSGSWHDGAAFEEELQPLRGSLYTLLPFLECGHSAYYLPGGLFVRHYRDGSCRMILFPPLSSDPVYYPASTPEELLLLVGGLVGGSVVSSPEWELC